MNDRLSPDVGIAGAGDGDGVEEQEIPITARRRGLAARTPFLGLMVASFVRSLNPIRAGPCGPRAFRRRVSGRGLVNWKVSWRSGSGDRRWGSGWGPSRS